MRHFYVYILSTKSRVLYTGITDDIYRRTWEHKNDVNPGFTRDYKVHRLVYYETFKYVNNAIVREKTIKGWLRRKKIALIEAENPTWEDLSASWFDGSRSFPFGKLRVRMTNSLGRTNGYKLMLIHPLPAYS